MALIAMALALGCFATAPDEFEVMATEYDDGTVVSVLPLTVIAE